jgi:hypothetical protein
MCRQHKEAGSRARPPCLHGAESAGELGVGEVGGEHVVVAHRAHQRLESALPPPKDERHPSVRHNYE